MTKHKLQKILEKAGIQTNTMELRVFVPTENAVIYMQVGDGSQLDRDEDESGTPYDGYIDYKTSEWDYDENCFAEGDGGIFEYVANAEDAILGELYSRVHDVLCYLYEDAVEDADFAVQVLKEMQ